MKELSNHKIYELLESEYTRIDLDYVILSLEDEYLGENTHKEAVINAFDILNKRYETEDYSIDIQPEKMKAVKIEIDELLARPEEEYIKSKGGRSFSIPSPISYWFAFLEPPYGNPYLKKDFEEFNNILFPNKDACEVFSWNNDFSNYFEAGKEWWGTGLWSVFDKNANTIVIIGASLTD